MKLSVIGIDVRKTVLRVHGADAQGKPVLRKTFSRGVLMEWLAQQAPCLIGMEVCAGAHHLARVLTDCGHTVRLIHPSFVKAYVKSNKNDFRDAEAIVESVTRSTMRFVVIKTVAQQELQPFHRLRSGTVAQRTAIINPVRGLLLEFGITVPQRPTALRRRLPAILETADGKFGDGHPFASGRAVTATLGLVPRQHSTGGRSPLGGITANAAIPTFVLCSSAVHGLLRYADRRDDSRVVAGSGRSRNGVEFRWLPCGAGQQDGADRLGGADAGDHLSGSRRL